MKATKRPLPSPPSATMRPSSAAKIVGLTAVAVGASIFAVNFDLGFLSTPSARRLAVRMRKPKKQKKQRHRSTQSSSIDKALYETDGTMSISRANKLVYIHTPKTGGSSVENSVLFDDARSHHTVGGHFSVDHMTLDAQERGINDFVKAAHIRHPCSRFISAYAYLTSDICNPGDKRWAKEHIGNMSLDDFILKLEREPGLTGKAHLRPLHHWLFYPDGTFGLDVALCQENWNESLDVLGEYLGGSDRIPKELYSSHSLQNAHNSCAELRPETRQAIERVYAMDYCIFGFFSQPKTGCQQTKETPEVFTERYANCVARFGAPLSSS